MKIAIFGSRKINEKEVNDVLTQKMDAKNEYITSGNIDGAAKIAIKVAKEKGIKITLYNYESGLGYYIAMKDIMIKNRKMVKECDEAIVFWNGESKGTKREIEMLEKSGKQYQLIMLDSKSDFDFDFDFDF
jgi:2-succinyl-5-enolpyruvyl-6-hydroxy-3-cyclohexene-1-carboxylate synthase